jgi:hypothetical protein
MYRRTGRRSPGNVANIDGEPTAVPRGLNLALIALMPHGGDCARAHWSQQHTGVLQLATFGDELLRCHVSETQGLNVDTYLHMIQSRTARENNRLNWRRLWR